MLYTKDTYKPEHIGCRVRWERKEGNEYDGNGEGVLKDVTQDWRLPIAVLADDKKLNKEGEHNLHWVTSYELLPMPLKEAYDRGLLRVGQKIKISHPCKDGYEKSVWRIEAVNTDYVYLTKLSGENGYSDDFTYDYGWLVEILEEPEENPFMDKEYKEAVEQRFNPKPNNTMYILTIVEKTDNPNDERVLDVELTKDQYEKVKKAVLENWA